MEGAKGIQSYDFSVGLVPRLRGSPHLQLCEVQHVCTSLQKTRFKARVAKSWTYRQLVTEEKNRKLDTKPDQIQSILHSHGKFQA